MSDAALALRLSEDVVAARRGDHGAFARLVDATRSTVASISLAILRDAELAAEVAQDVYLAAWTDLRKLRDPSSFLPWLRQITRNRAHHVLRGRIRERRRVSEGDADALLAMAADPRPDAMQSLLEHEEREALAAAIDDLPVTAREVVVLYYREGRSARQVAELLGMSEDAVKQRLSRARGRLREALIHGIARTAPTAAFTATVMTAVSIAAPSAAAAATVAGYAGAKTAAKLGVSAPAASAAAGALAGALGGLLGGLTGLAYGTRRQLHLARDDQERRGVLAGAAICLVCMVGFMGTVLAMPRPLPVTIAFGVMISVFGLVHFAWLPRVTRRRYAAELEEDPQWAREEHRRRRRHARLGYGLGLLFGGGTVLASWFF